MSSKAGTDMDFEIRACSRNDYRYTHDLHRSNMIHYVNKYWGGWNSDVYERDFRPRITWIVEQDGDRVGFFVLDFSSKAHLLNLQIQPSCQNLGLGSRIVKYCETECVRQGFDTLFLEAFLDNPARALYERLGYDTYQVTASHYMMKKRLDIESGNPTQQDT